MRGGQNRLPNEVKQAQGTFRPSRSRNSPKPTSLAEWPSAPKAFSKEEKVAWKRLGDAVMPLGTVGSGDLVMATYLAKLMARADQAFADPTTKLTALNSLLRMTAALLRDFGLSPTSRNAVSALSSEVEEHDALSEFV
jgi:phage terminase small subunit